MYAKNVLEKRSPKGKDSLVVGRVEYPKTTNFLQPKNNFKNMYKNSELRYFSMATVLFLGGKK